MSDATEARSTRFTEPPQTIHRHPYSRARYGAYDGQHVLVEQDEAWGIFNRNAEWLEGPLRNADPVFTRWVTGKHLMDAVLASKGRLEDWS
jgi:hypothetical protein